MKQKRGMQLKEGEINMDIIQGEYQKKIIRLTERLLLKKLSTSYDAIDDDLKHSGNFIIKFLYMLILFTASKINEDYQKNTLKHLGGLGLWIFYKDTAYRDYFFFTLYQLLKRSDELLPIVEQYVKNPEDWYVNQWHESKKRTKKLREKGLIPNTEMSEEEKIFTPVIQNNRIKKLVK